MDNESLPELYFSVDIEANGPIPGEFSMTSLGCAVVGRPEAAFYVELKPVSDRTAPSAEVVAGLTLDYLREHGAAPEDAMQRFCDWVTETAGGRYRPVFVALNASFDWMFVHWYFMRYVGENPFSIGGLDIKAYYMGMMGVPWSETASEMIGRQFCYEEIASHHALEDAREQAVLFERMLAHNTQSDREAV
jgi:hypothetical protein